MVVKSEHQGLRFPPRRRASLLYRLNFRPGHGCTQRDHRGRLVESCCKKISKTRRIMFALSCPERGRRSCTCTCMARQSSLTRAHDGRVDL